MNIIERIKAPTPKFFAKLRNLSILMAGIGASVLAAPIALPAIALKVAGYIAVAGSVGTAISQSVTNGEGETGNKEPGTGQ